MGYEELEVRNNLYYQNTKYLFDSELPKGSGGGKDFLAKKYDKYGFNFETHHPMYNQLLKFNTDVEQTLDEYFQYKYGISNEQLATIVSNVNNFKLKHNNFQKVVQGGLEYYYDKSVLFLMVDIGNFNIHKRW